MNRIWLLVAMLLMLVATACNGSATLAPTSAAPTQAPAAPTKPATVPTVPVATALPPTATPAPTSANPLDALTKMFNSWSGVKSFRAKMTTSGGTGKAIEMAMEVVMPDHFHLTNDQMEVIKLGADIYLKVAGKWQKMSLPQGVDFSFADVKKLQGDLGVTTETKLLGPELLDGTPTLVYQYVTTIKTPVPTTSTTKVWVGVTDNLPRKMESVAKSGAKTVVLYYDYNANIKIDPPIK